MVDLHTHLMSNVDDGSKSLLETLDLLREAESAGIKHLVLTPHYVKNSKYNANNKVKKEKLLEIKKLVRKNNIDLKIYLGNEILIEGNLEELLEKEEITTINNSKYLLIEAPFTSLVNNIRGIIFNLRLKGLIPIIAHPERCTIFKEDKELMEDLIEQGALFQLDIFSLTGKYGKTNKKVAKEMLKNNFYHCISSDVHHRNDYQDYKKALKKLRRIIGKKKKEQLLENGLKIIENKKIA